MCIKADKREIVLLSNDILVGIVKIKAGRLRNLFDTVHIFRHETDDRDTTFTQDIPDKIREKTGGLFLVQDNPD